MQNTSKLLFPLLCVLFFTACRTMPSKTVSEIKPPSDCNCLINLDYVIDKISHNYAGYADKVNDKTKAKYTALVDSLQIIAKTETTLRGCDKIIRKYCDFYFDKHLQFGADLSSEPMPQNANGQTNAPQILQTIWNNDLIVNELDKRKNTLNPIEGVWNTEGYQVGVVFNEKEKTYDAVVLKAENPNWKPGMLKFRSKISTSNRYETAYARGDMRIDTLQVRVLKNALEIPKYGLWKKSYPISKDTLTDAEITSEMGDVQFRYLNDSTVYIALKSCAIELKPVLDALMQKNTEKLKKTPYWVVDFRGNSGGDTDTYKSLLPYLYTKKDISRSSKNWLTPEHVQKWVEVLEKNKQYMDSSSIRYMTKRIDFGKKNPNAWYDDGMDTTFFDKILPFPKKVAVLSDEENGSSGETFLMQARGLSDKVTIFGQNSGGYLDYGNLNQFLMPCDKMGIYIPMRRANYLDFGVSYDKSGYPPDIYIPKTNKDWVGFVFDYWAKNPQPWKKIYTTEKYPGKQDDITFVDENTGWYVNGFGNIYHTEDGGNTWQNQLQKKGTFFRCIAFLDKNLGFAGTVGTDYFPNVTDTIPLYGTKDGGKTWSPVAYIGPYVKGLCALDIVKEQYINHGEIAYKTHIYGVGRVGSPANSLISHDGGETWVSKSMNNDAKMLFDIKMLNKNEGFAAAASDEDTENSNAVILRTTDGAKTWQKVFQSTRPFETTWKIAFPTKDVGYVTIQSYNPDTLVTQQHIAKTTDGGKTWQEINLVKDNTAREFGIAFMDAKHGFVGTMNSGFETKDGGQTWEKINLGRACNKIRLYKRGDGSFYGYSIGVSLFKM
jgi:photosystem II stability/assembly factor-like uncharacterized protein